MVLKVYKTSVNFCEKLLKLKHENLQEVYSIFDEMEKTYVVSEYIVGETLESKLLNNDLTEIEIQSYMLQLCNAVEYLHKQTPVIIHRDIKLSNIIITNEGDLKLVDYDTAREVTNADLDTTFVGTRDYAIPEQYGFTQTNERTDIYAIGIVLYKLMGGKDEKLISQYQGKYSQIIKRCTSFDPKKTYSSVSALKSKFDKNSNTKFNVMIALVGFLVSAFVILIIMGYISLSSKEEVANKIDMIDVVSSKEKNVENTENTVIEDDVVEASKETVGFDKTKDTVILTIRENDLDYDYLDYKLSFSVAPYYDYTQEIYVPVEILDYFPDTEYEVEYNSQTIFIERLDRKLELKVNHDISIINGYEVNSDVRFENNKDYLLPLEFVATNLGFEVNIPEGDVNNGFPFVYEVIYTPTPKVAVNGRYTEAEYETTKITTRMPILIGLESDVEREVNDKLQGYQQEYFDKFTELYNTEYKKINLEQDYELQFFDADHYINDKYLSFEAWQSYRIINTSFNPGVVESNILIKHSYNIDLRTGEFLTLEDIFKEDYKDVLFLKAKEIVNTNPDVYVGVDDAYLEEIVNNFDCFYMSPTKKLVLSYTKLNENVAENQPIEFTFELKELMDILSDKYLELL